MLPPVLPRPGSRVRVRMRVALIVLSLGAAVLLTVAARPAPARPTAAEPHRAQVAPGQVITTETGLRYQVLAVGDGLGHPGLDDRVTVRMSGWDARGRPLIEAGMVAALPVRALIPGWVEALERMAVGDRLRLWIPPHLGYLAGPGPTGTLIFDVELLAFEPMPDPRVN